ncbi:MAG: hypothetical protein RSC93_00545 [Erysipelotrichaceae bacterium]
MKDILLKKSKTLNDDINSLMSSLYVDTNMSDDQFKELESLVNKAIMYGGIYNSINQIEQIEKMEITTKTGTWSL